MIPVSPPLRRRLRSLSTLLQRRILGEGQADWRGLLLPWFQTELIQGQRSLLIISRARIIAALFALLTPTWIVVDLLLLPTPVWWQLALARLTASAAFAILAFRFRDSDRLGHAYQAAGWLFLIPSLFQILSQQIIFTQGIHLEGAAHSLVAGYAFLPFVLVAGLSVFPFTTLEGIALVIPALLLQGVSGAFTHDWLSMEAHFGLLWLLSLIGGVAVLSGMSQLHYLSEIIIKSAHDPLTKVYNRGSGRELLEKYLLLAQRNHSSLTLIFFDLDHFKSVNDRFGHEAGDQVLRDAANALRARTRRVDLLIRWGGEEFVLVMPHEEGSDGDRLARILDRLGAQGLGKRPDGEPLTASVGIAHLEPGQTVALPAFVEQADQRMYRAKQSGRNRVCFGDGEHDITPVGFFG